MKPELPQLEYVLTAQDRRQAEHITTTLERLRRERNARDRAAQRRKDREPA